MLCCLQGRRTEGGSLFYRPRASQKLHFHVCVERVMHAVLWQSEDNLQELVLSFHYVGPRGGAQVLRPGDKCSYPLSHLLIPFFSIYNLL